MVRRWTAFVWVVVLVFCVHVMAAAPAKDLPVISTLMGEGPSDTLRTIQSDGLGSYRHSAKASSGVQSIIQGAGGWELDVFYFTTNRRLYFDLRNLVEGSGALDAPTTMVTAPGRLITKCNSTTENFLQMNPNSSLYNCALHGRFDYNGRTLLVRMDEASFPGTRNVKVSCTGTDPANPARCHHWRIDTCTAQDSAGLCTQWGFDNGPVDLTANVMTILEETSSRGKITTRKVGDYYMQFEIYASKQ
ncbi:MAG TPA: hypothetical protein VM791_19960 [Vicinamibacterales bacterium]|nr:hypothetical protein [Vicinamibacterales bacterium]